MATSSTGKPMEALPSGSGSILSNVVAVLLLSLGFVFGMVYNANFQQSHLTPFLQPLPSLTPVVASGVGPPSPSPTSSPHSPPPRMGFVDFLAPSGGGLTHNMTDEELFWRASMVPRVARAPTRIVPKVAFLFLVTGDMPLRPLWEKFFAGHEGLYSIYVHASPAYTGSPPADSVFYGRMIPSQVTSKMQN